MAAKPWTTGASSIVGASIKAQALGTIPYACSLGICRLGATTSGHQVQPWQRTYSQQALWQPYIGDLPPRTPSSVSYTDHTMHACNVRPHLRALCRCGHGVAELHSPKVCTPPPGARGCGELVSRIRACHSTCEYAHSLLHT